MKNIDEEKSDIEITKLQIVYLDRIIKTKKPYNIKFDKYDLVILPKVFPPYCDNQLIIENVVFERDDKILVSPVPGLRCRCLHNQHKIFDKPRMCLPRKSNEYDLA